ncbi:MAG: CHAT domain-containing protein [Saprospiraceae bacterium]|nr:CHAT domain-containing protein [Saprospiraceae bacterium]
MSVQRVMYFASSFDENHPLSKVYTEGINIFKSVNSIPEWKCMPSFRIRDDIVRTDFTKRDFSYQVFHFAGHAVDEKLQFNNQFTSVEQLKYGSMFMVGVGGLAKIIRALHPVQLVFLNGCATHTQVEMFRKEGIPAVIYTTRALRDTVGKAFAEAFYQAFLIEKNTLEKSFDLATANVEFVYPNFQNDYDNETEAMFKRGIADLDALPQMDLYALDADEAFKNMTWEQWPMNLTGEPVQPLPAVTLPQDPRDKQKKGIPLEAVHLCDRNAETDQFRDVLRQLATQQTSGPVFVFVHDQSEACPESLIKRFQLFGVKDLCSTDRGIDPAGFVWKDVKLRYEQNILKHPDWCKSRLFEIYNDELFPCDHDAAMQNYVFRPSQYGNKVFVVHHDLTELEPENAASVRPLLEFYLHEFSSKLVSELQARLVVVISYQYFMEEKDMETLFSDLTTDPRFAGRVLNLTGMEAVTRKHVGAWRHKVFEDRNFPLPPEVQEFCPTVQENTWSMSAVRKKLADALELYNHKIETSHGRP